MTRQVVRSLIAALAVALAHTAAAQSINQRQPGKAERPVGGGVGVLSEYEGLLVWRGSDDPSFTLWTLANYAAPIMWFSPDEPLLRAGANLPQALPPLTGTTPPKGPHRVYYNIREVVIRNEPACAPLVTGQDAVAHPLANENLPWNDEPGAPVGLEYPPLDCLETVKIRFFFYYSSELGVGAHMNDFESFQVNVRMLRDTDPVQYGGFSLDTGACVDGGQSHHCALVTGVHGSAHGIAWYTNGLDVERNPDTLMPPTVMVEEGKHASAPDRNSDGVYTPGFDVDMHPADAWGVRDTLRTRSLQGPAFHAEMAKRRVERDRVFPPVPNWRVAETWAVRTIPGAERDPGRAATAAWLPTYELVSMREAVAGILNAQEVKYCEARGDQISPIIPRRAGCENGGQCDTLESLFQGEEGCRRTRVLPDKGWLVVKHAFARANIGGPHDEYLTWPRFFGERIAPAYRHSGGTSSISWTPPVAWNVPGVDGWVSARLNFRKTGGDGLIEGIVDGVYSVSAAQYFSLYVAGGVDRLPASDSEDGGAQKAAIEGGFRWRFTFLGVFLGARVGVRAVDPAHFRHPRLVVEFGGGSW